MENKKKVNYNPEDRDSEARQAGTNRDSAITNQLDHSDESGTSPSRNEQYHAGGTDKITGTTSISDTRNAETARTSGFSRSTNEDDLEDERHKTGQTEFDSENLDDESDDFLKGSGRDYGQEQRLPGNSKPDPDFEDNAAV